MNFVESSVEDFFVESFSDSNFWGFDLVQAIIGAAILGLAAFIYRKLTTESKSYILYDDKEKGLKVSDTEAVFLDRITFSRYFEDTDGGTVKLKRFLAPGDIYTCDGEGFIYYKNHSKALFAKKFYWCSDPDLRQRYNKMRDYLRGPRFVIPSALIGAYYFTAFMLTAKATSIIVVGEKTFYPSGESDLFVLSFHADLGHTSKEQKSVGPIEIQYCSRFVNNFRSIIKDDYQTGNTFRMNQPTPFGFQLVRKKSQLWRILSLLLSWNALTIEHRQKTLKKPADFLDCLPSYEIAGPPKYGLRRLRKIHNISEKCLEYSEPYQPIRFSLKEPKYTEDAHGKLFNLTTKKSRRKSKDRPKLFLSPSGLLIWISFSGAIHASQLEDFELEDLLWTIKNWRKW